MALTLIVCWQVRPVPALQQTHYLIYGTMMDFQDGREKNPTADREEKGSLTRANYTALVKGSGQGTLGSFHPGQTHGSGSCPGCVRQRKRIRIRLNARKLAKLLKRLQVDSESRCLVMGGISNGPE